MAEEIKSTHSTTSTTNSNSDSRESGGYHQRRYQRKDRRFSFGKKQCYFKKNNIRDIDYRDINLLRKFIGKTGKIMPKRFTGVSPRAQRRLAIAIKRARYMALLPYTGELQFLERNYPRKKMEQSPRPTRETREREEV